MDDYLSRLAAELTSLITTAQQDGDLPGAWTRTPWAALAATVQGSCVLACASGDPGAQTHVIDGLISLNAQKDS